MATCTMFNSALNILMRLNCGIVTWMLESQVHSIASNVIYYNSVSKTLSLSKHERIEAFRFNYNSIVDDGILFNIISMQSLSKSKNYSDTWVIWDIFFNLMETMNIRKKFYLSQCRSFTSLVWTFFLLHT